MIVIVSDLIPPEHSGAGKRIFNFYSYLKPKNIEVKLITTVNREDDNNIISLKIIRRFHPKINQFLNLYYFFFQLVLMIFKFHNKDVAKSVWLTSVGPLTNASALFFRLLGYKIITQNTLVGSDDPAFKYPGDLLSIKYSLKNLQYHLSNNITCISPALYEISQKYHSNCSMIPNPVSKQFKYNEKIKHDRVLFVGALGIRKGIDIVFKTINLIHKISPEVEFTLVGPKEDLDTILNDLKEETAFINWDKVFLKGFQENTQPYFAESSIFFLPSRREGFGIVFIEAMASGLPVVAKKLTGITDYIFGENYETIICSEAPKEYADAILELINTQEKYQRLSKMGLELVKRFDEEKIYGKYLSLMEKI